MNMMDWNNLQCDVKNVCIHVVTGYFYTQVVFSPTGTAQNHNFFLVLKFIKVQIYYNVSFVQIIVLQQYLSIGCSYLLEKMLILTELIKYCLKPHRSFFI